MSVPATNGGGVLRAMQLCLQSAQWARELGCTTLEEYIALLQREIDNSRALPAELCIHCGRPTGIWGDRRYHQTPTGGRSNLGCRAASFDWRWNPETQTGSWDDTLSDTKAQIA